MIKIGKIIILGNLENDWDIAWVAVVAPNPVQRHYLYCHYSDLPQPQLPQPLLTQPLLDST